MSFFIDYDYSSRPVVILTNADKLHSMMMQDPLVFVASLSVNMT